MDGLGLVILWLIIALVGQSFALILARRAQKNRRRVKEESNPPIFNLMARSIEVDAIFTVILLGFMIGAGLSALPISLGIWVAWTEVLRVYVARPLIVGALATTAIRLIVQYGFLKVIEERQREIDDAIEE